MHIRCILSYHTWHVLDMIQWLRLDIRCLCTSDLRSGSLELRSIISQFFISRSYLACITAAALQRLLPNFNRILERKLVFEWFRKTWKISEGKKLVLPTPDVVISLSISTLLAPPPKVNAMFLSFIPVTPQWAQCRLKSPASWLFTQPFIQAQIKETIKASRHWSLCGEFTGHRWMSRTMGQ